MKNCENLKTQIVKKETEEKNQTQLKTPGRNVGGEEKHTLSTKRGKYENAALKVRAQN